MERLNLTGGKYTVVISRITPDAPHHGDLTLSIAAMKIFLAVTGVHQHRDFANPRIEIIVATSRKRKKLAAAPYEVRRNNLPDFVRNMTYDD